MKLSILATLLFTAFTTQAATTGTLLLQGIVLPKLSITVTPETIASTLDLETTQTNLKVAEVREKANLVLGYKVTITSDNLGNLKRVSGSQVFPYTLKYNNNVVNLSTGQTFSYPTALVANNVRDVSVSYIGVPAENMVEGTYSDILTFSIASN